MDVETAHATLDKESNAGTTFDRHHYSVSSNTKADVRDPATRTVHRKNHSTFARVAATRDENPSTVATVGETGKHRR